MTDTTGLIDGISLRDYFAVHASRDEISDISHRTISRDAAQQLTGLKCPEEPPQSVGHQQRVAWQIERAKYEAAVMAALRFIYADAMLKASGQ